MKIYGIDFGLDEMKYLVVYDTETSKCEILEV